MAPPRIAAAASIVALLIGASDAYAESRPSHPGEASGYGYEFRDDPIALALRDGHLAILPVRVRGTRCTLVRPRTSFVAELIGSADSL